jgi:hypothetical protein
VLLVGKKWRIVILRRRRRRRRRRTIWDHVCIKRALNMNGHPISCFGQPLKVPLVCVCVHCAVLLVGKTAMIATRRRKRRKMRMIYLSLLLWDKWPYVQRLPKQEVRRHGAAQGAWNQPMHQQQQQ